MADQNHTPDRPGPLQPRSEGDDVVIHNPPGEPMRMSAEEADISGIRMLDEAAKARDHSIPSPKEPK